jgi:hypothetical protein
VGDARNKIAEVFRIIPASRVAIESGRGSFLDDHSAPLFSLIDSSAISVDFFGHTTAYCYIFIKEEEEKPLSLAEGDRPHLQTSSTFRSLLGNIKGEVKYGDIYCFNCKAPSADVDAAAFFIAPMDKFASAAPAHIQAAGTGLVKILEWKNTDNGNSRAGTEIGDGVSDAGGGFGAEPVSPRSLASSSNKATSAATAAGDAFRSVAKAALEKAGSIHQSMAGVQAPPIRDGDMIVLECDGK